MSDVCPLCAPDEFPHLQQGVMYSSDLHHPECGLRMVIGGIGHSLDHAHFCIQRRDPDAGLTYRQSAKLVDTWVRMMGIEETVGRSISDEPEPVNGAPQDDNLAWDWREPPP